MKGNCQEEQERSLVCMTSKTAVEQNERQEEEEEEGKLLNGNFVQFQKFYNMSKVETLCSHTNVIYRFKLLIKLRLLYCLESQGKS